MTENDGSLLIAAVAAIILLSDGYAEKFGPYQFRLVEWLIVAVGIPGRWRGLTNLAVGTTLATAFTAVVAAQTGAWRLLPAGMLAGILASVKAGEVHDGEDRPSPA